MGAVVESSLMVGHSAQRVGRVSGVERTFDPEEIIVSKTDLKGVITYANEVFVRVSGYSEAELIGKPHNILRHPDMPRGMFRLLWSELQAGNEVFVYVKNLTPDGGFYWVYAHVTPTWDQQGRIVGYHSNRRSPVRAAIIRIEPVYAHLRQVEAQHSNARQAADAGHAALVEYLIERQMSYSQFVWSLSREPSATSSGRSKGVQR